MIIKPSTREDKRLMAIFGKGQNGRDIIRHFGSPSPSEAFVDHGEKDKKRNYIARHKPREDWQDPYSAGALSRYILWETTDIDKNIRTYKKRFWEYQL